MCVMLQQLIFTIILGSEGICVKRQRNLFVHKIRWRLKQNEMYSQFICKVDKKYFSLFTLLVTKHCSLFFDYSFALMQGEGSAHELFCRARVIHGASHPRLYLGTQSPNSRQENSWPFGIFLHWHERSSLP